MESREKLIKKMRGNRMTYGEIGKLLGISRQRVHQIHTHYKVPVSSRNSPTIPESILIPKTGELREIQIPIYIRNFEGRDRTREYVRWRDGFTCQICFKEWEEGKRRFDIHHLNGLCGKLSSAYDKLSDVDGLITLCHKCHLNLDSVKKRMLEKSSPRPNKPKTLMKPD